MSANIGGRAGSARRLAGAAVLAAFCTLAFTATAWAQFPDNRDVKLNPEDPVSPEYGRTLDERDRQRREEAYESGGSFITTVQGTGRASGESLPRPLEYRGEDAAIDAAVPEPYAEPVRPAPVYESAAVPQADGGVADGGLAAMIGVLLESWTRPPSVVRLRYAAPPERGGDAARSDAVAEGSGAGDDRLRLPRIAPGQGFYARTLYAVDSDYPGPVVLELLQPPLAGAIAHGGFERVRQRLVLRLTSLTWKGRTFPVDAWAVDPECACYGIEGEVDRHFVSRVLLPAAARFAEGFLTAVAAPARTLTMQDGTVFHERRAGGEREALHAGAGAAARTLGDILMADAPKETTVRIPRGTPLVVMVARHSPASPDLPAPDLRRRERADAGQ